MIDISDFKQTLKELSEERKRDVPLPVYVFWWIVRVLMIFAIVDLIIKGKAGLVSLSVNLFVCFLFTIFKLFPKEKFFLSRLSFRAETIIHVLNLVTTYLGGYLDFYDNIPLWDMSIHFLMSVTGVYLGYAMTLAAANKQNDLTPVVGAICGVGWCSWGSIVWEIFEFTYDQLTGSNVQYWRFIKRDFEMFSTSDPVRYALFDTMSDLMLGFAGSMVGGVLLYAWLAKKARKAEAVPDRPETVQAMNSMQM